MVEFSIDLLPCIYSSMYIYAYWETYAGQVEGEGGSLTALYYNLNIEELVLS